jgi:hypothetical protein
MPSEGGLTVAEGEAAALGGWVGHCRRSSGSMVDVSIGCPQSDAWWNDLHDVMMSATRRNNHAIAEAGR